MLLNNINEMEHELGTLDAQLYRDTDKEASVDSEEFVVKTKSGRRYSNEVRQLYYQLFSKHIPPGIICDTIKAVFKALAPSVNVESLQLPQRSTIELQTIT